MANIEQTEILSNGQIIKRCIPNKTDLFIEGKLKLDIPDLKPWECCEL